MRLLLDTVGKCLIQVGFTSMNRWATYGRVPVYIAKGCVSCQLGVQSKAKF